VALFIAKRIRSNIRELEGALRRVIANARFTGQPITLDFTKEALRDLLALQARLITIENIQKTVADYFKVRVADLLSEAAQSVRRAGRGRSPWRSPRNSPATACRKSATPSAAAITRRCCMPVGASRNCATSEQRIGEDYSEPVENPDRLMCVTCGCFREREIIHNPPTGSAPDVPAATALARRRQDR
jgi:hypothetical protein